MKYYFLIFLMFASVNAIACDACNFLEYGNLQNKSYLSLNYRHRALNGYNFNNQINNFSFNGAGNFKVFHQVGNDSITSSQEDQEVFRSIELKINLNLKNNWNIIVSLPYNTHKVYFEEVTRSLSGISFDQSDSTNSVSGLGDVQLYLEKYWIIEEGQWKLYVRLSPGVQIPTGQSGISENGQVFDPVIQPGMGVLAFLLRTNNTLIYNARLGFSLGANLLKAQKKDLSENSILAGFVSSSGVTSYQFGTRYNLGLSSVYILN